MARRPGPAPAWRRAAAAILGTEGLLTAVYAGFVPAPLLSDVGVEVPLLGRLPMLWVVVGAVRLAAAAGVAMSAAWGRVLAIVVQVPTVVLAAAGVAGAFLRLGLVDIVWGSVWLGLDVTVLFAVVRRWPVPAPPAQRTHRPARPARRPR
jgi:hypothetical protein